MGTIDEEIIDISTPKKTQENSDEMDPIKRFPLKGPFEIFYSKSSQWTIPKSYTFPVKY